MLIIPKSLLTLDLRIDHRDMGYLYYCETNARILDVVKKIVIYPHHVENTHMHRDYQNYNNGIHALQYNHIIIITSIRYQSMKDLASLMTLKLPAN